MTKGMKTSEFYLALSATLLSFYSVYSGFDAGSIAAANSVAIAYIGNRAYVKRGDGER